MALDICQATLDNLKACTAALEVQWAEIQEGIDFAIESGDPNECVAWFDEERRDILRQATILVYIAALDLACYPLSESSVLFIE